MKRKTILTSAILALLAVGQGHADNSFVVKDSNTGKKQLEGKLSTVSRICFKDGKMEVRFADKTTRELAFTNSTVPSSTSGDCSMAVKIRSAPASAASRKLPCWVNWLMGRVVWRTNTR